MLMNYHEMTMNESKDSPQKKLQFMVICTVISAVLAHTCMTSGVFNPMDIKTGVFPGGYFVFKQANRDYAASAALGQVIREDLGLNREDGDDLIYHLFLDDPRKMGGRRQRWMSGLLTNDQGADMMSKLLANNEEIMKKPLTEGDIDGPFELPAIEVFKRIPYDQADLQSVDSLVLNFPFTNGFVSSLIISYKIIPAMRQMAIEKGEKDHTPVVITTCSVKQEMCTHYSPLVQSRSFLLGNPDTDTHNAALGEEKFIDAKGLADGLRKLLPKSVSEAIGLL